jgi:hypothetical protein
MLAARINTRVLKTLASVAVVPFYKILFCIAKQKV